MKVSGKIIRIIGVALFSACCLYRLLPATVKVMGMATVRAMPREMEPVMVQEPATVLIADLNRSVSATVISEFTI